MEQLPSKKSVSVRSQPSKTLIYLAENPFETFIVNELQALGATQIVSGMVQLTFGIPLIYPSIFSVAGSFGTMWWSGAMCFLTGIMNVLLHNMSSRNFVRVTLLVNCLNSFVSGGGIVLYLISVIFSPTDETVYQTVADVSHVNPLKDRSLFQWCREML
ncbi:high affinity immunoglobulin epsilon receptor subunit beta-like isoform X2 [Chiloscyllium punctatum]|uniref:high affinity immunoglobulin epsilon receptor subunit beta-like isoform X2 n=1 Tax=Chiloscyllium punctatum TaxID=137246 RepID=UPI003B637381